MSIKVLDWIKQLFAKDIDLDNKISLLTGVAFQKPTPITPRSLNHESVRENGNYSAVFSDSPFAGTCVLSVYEVAPTYILQQLCSISGAAWRIITKTGDVSDRLWTRFAMTRHSITQQNPDDVVISGNHTTNVGTLPATGYFHIFSQIEADSNYGHQFAFHRDTGLGYFRRRTVTWRAWQQIATTDKIDNLFSGATSTGNITLAFTSIDYHELVLQTQLGSNTGAIDKMYGYYYPSKMANGTYKVATTNGVLTITISGTTFTITANPSNVIITSIWGLKRGGV